MPFSTTSICSAHRLAYNPLHKVWTEALSRHAGIQLYQVKTKTWNQAGIVPENVENLGPAAWQPEGVTVLGTLIRSPQYVARRKMDERISEERELWMAIPTVPDLQCAWQLLVQSAKSSRQPHHAHDATVPVSGLLSRPRRWNTAHSNGALGGHSLR